MLAANFTEELGTTEAHPDGEDHREAAAAAEEEKLVILIQEKKSTAGPAASQRWKNKGYGYRIRNTQRETCQEDGLDIG